MDAIVEKAWERVSEALADNFRVCVDPDGTFVHFTTRLHQLSRGQINNSITYEALAAYMPSLPPEAVFVLRRFASENRRYWHENPRTRELVPIQRSNRLLSTFVLKESSDLMDPASLVSLSSKNAEEMAGMVEAGTLHTLGRDVFYYSARIAPKTSAESRARAKEWRLLLKSVE